MFLDELPDCSTPRRYGKVLETCEIRSGWALTERAAVRVQQNSRESTSYSGVSRSGYDGGDMAHEETLDKRFLKEIYALAKGEATRLVSGEELARKLGMNPEDEIDEARFLGTARRLEEEGYVIANKTGPEVRDYSSLSLTHAGVQLVEKG